jgi:hypothetical protein
MVNALLQKIVQAVNVKVGRSGRSVVRRAPRLVMTPIPSVPSNVCQSASAQAKSLFGAARKSALPREHVFHARPLRAAIGVMVCARSFVTEAHGVLSPRSWDVTQSATGNVHAIHVALVQAFLYRVWLSSFRYLGVMGTEDTDAPQISLYSKESMHTF